MYEASYPQNAIPPSPVLADGRGRGWLRARRQSCVSPTADISFPLTLTSRVPRRCRDAFGVHMIGLHQVRDRAALAETVGDADTLQADREPLVGDRIGDGAGEAA